jgi:cell division protease FtsH
MNSKLIDEKKLELEHAATELKSYFVGLDGIIDEIISKISPWYIMPELVNRPLVICLWGMTGVGKTDLVRRLVSLLNFQDRFEEVQMTIDNTKSLTIESTISGNENINLGSPYILLLDEIQRFRSVEESGGENHTSSYKDIWDLLSDGKLIPEVDLNSLYAMLYSYKEYNDIRSNKKKLKKMKDDCETAEDYLDYRFDNNYFHVKVFKQLLNLSESIEEIINMSLKTKYQLLNSAVADKTLYKHKDYTKGLIFVSGNIDEAYSVAASTDDVDYDADLYNTLTKKINIIDIKRALKKRFKPEQIARFGNNNILYPSMSKKSFEEIINRRCEEICTNIKKQTMIKIDIDDSVKKLIYNNGVFPVQGTRPLFSTITDIIERNSLTFIYKFTSSALDIKKFKIIYRDEKLIAIVNSVEVFEIPYVGDIDKIRQKNRNNEDKKYAVAVHEAGHALLYAIHFKVAPTQVIALTTNNYAEGYMALHSMSDTYSMLKRQIDVVYGGAAAEEMVFGKEHLSSGSASDVTRATQIASSIVRKFAMTNVKCEYITNDEEQLGNRNINETNDTIKSMCKQSYDNALKLLSENVEVYKSVVNALLTKEVLSSEDFVDICAEHDLKIRVVDCEDILYDNLKDYYKLWAES